MDHADARRWLTRPEDTLLYWRSVVSFQIGYVLTALGRYEEARRVCEEPSSPRDRVLQRQSESYTSLLLGWTYFYRGEYAEARLLLHECLELNQKQKNPNRTGTALTYLAEIEIASGEVVQAREHLRRSLAIGRAMDRPGLVCFSLEGLGRLELEMGRPDRAAELYRKSLAFGKRSGIERDIHTQIALVGAARAALAMGGRIEAKECVRRALCSSVYWVHDRIEGVATMAQVCAAEGDIMRATELLAFVVAHPGTAHRTRQPMSRLLAELEAELPAEQFAAAAAYGRARQLDEVVAEIVGTDAPE